ncbi:MAG: VWA domain-containing protein [Acidobacteriota bacterium]|nr:VWA domain-containing protein [Acidobacteriota bacterium]
MSRTRARFAVLLALSLAGRSAFTQVPEDAPRVSGSVETSVLELDVVVTDKDGKPVSGLGPADFEVRIAKRPVEITNFYERKPAPGPLPAGGPAPEGEKPPVTELAPVAGADRQLRHLVLFLDRLELPDKGKSEGTFGSLRTLVRNTLGPGDEAMIVTWERSLRSVLPFTSDLAALERVLGAQEALSRRMPWEASAIDRLSDDAAWFSSYPPGATSDGTEASRRALAAQAYGEMKAKASALRAILSTLGGLPGRKILVFASHRFSRLAGLEFLIRPRAMYGEIPGYAQEFNARGLIESVTTAANANGVTLYPVFPAGWPDDAGAGISAANPPSLNPQSNSALAGASGDMIVMNEADALDTLSESTGGRTGIGFKDIGDLVPRIQRDLDFSYSVGVAATLGKPGRDLAVDVKTKDRRLVVRARRSVVEKSPETRIKDRVLSNLFRPDSSSRLAISLASTAPETKKRRTTLLLPIRVPIGGLALVPSAGGFSGAFSVFVASAAADGRFSDVTQQRRPFEIARAEFAKAKTGHFTYQVPVVLGSPEARVSIGVFDEIGRDAGFLLVDVSGGIATVRR